MTLCFTMTTYGQSVNGHEYVNLGLSVKWATCNLGAVSPSDYGNYYAWGETSRKSTYMEENSETYGKSTYNCDIGGNISTDAAAAEWGGSWRLPTEEEVKELVDKCIWTWTTLDGRPGCKITGLNGNSIFLPAAGGMGGSQLYYGKTNGSYWTSSPLSGYNDRAAALFFNYRSHTAYRFDRSFGLPIRPVLK